jgi:hypothetical protein
VFKFYTKGDDRLFEGAIFLNGQKIATLYAGVYPDGEIVIQVEDGSGRLQTEWSDYEESD